VRGSRQDGGELMGYYIRILSKNLDDIPVEDLRKVARPAVIEMAEEGKDGWEQLVLKHASGPEIAIVEKNPVIDGQLGAKELQEFIEEVAHYKPASAADWLQNYLSSITIIYAFQLLSGTDVADGWTLLHQVYSAIRNRAGGICQADGEGFSNEDGFTILWQFSENVNGSWKLGILSKERRWVHFEMELGNKEQRDAFQRGEIPSGGETSFLIELKLAFCWAPG